MLESQTIPRRKPYLSAYGDKPGHDGQKLPRVLPFLADTALRLAKALGTTAQLWLNLQNDYDIQIAKRDLGKLLDRIETVNKPKAALLTALEWVRR